MDGGVDGTEPSLAGRKLFIFLFSLPHTDATDDGTTPCGDGNAITTFVTCATFEPVSDAQAGGLSVAKAKVSTTRYSINVYIYVICL